MQKKPDTPMREIRRKYEQRNKEKRKEAHRQFNTHVATDKYVEIDEFLSKNNITKVELILAGYETLKKQKELENIK